MTVRGFLVLCAITLVAVVAAAAAVIQRDRPETAVVAAGKVLPDLADRLADAAAITVATSETNLTIARSGQGWVLEDRGGYPVPADRVRALAVELANLEKVEGKTTRADRYAALGVRDVEAEGARSTRVRILDAGGTVLAQLLVGDRASGGDGVFVRIPGEERAWLARGSLDVGTRPRDWVDREIVDVPAPDIVRLRIDHADGETVRLAKEDPAAASLALVDVPAGRTVAEEASLQRMASAFSGLELDDVRAAETLVGDHAAARTVTATTASGLVLAATVYAIDDNAWLTLRAEAVDAAAADPADAEAETAAETARKINARTAGWIYQVPSWKVAPWEKRVAALTKPANRQSAD